MSSLRVCLHLPKFLVAFWFLVSWAIQSQSPVNFSQVPHLFSELLRFCGHDHKSMFSKSLPHQLEMFNITTNILEKDFQIIMIWQNNDIFVILNLAFIYRKMPWSSPMYREWVHWRHSAITRDGPWSVIISHKEKVNAKLTGRL